MKEYEAVPLPDDPAEEMKETNPDAPSADPEASLPQAVDNGGEGQIPAEEGIREGRPESGETPPVSEIPAAEAEGPAQNNPSVFPAYAPEVPFTAAAKETVPAVSCYGLSKQYGAVPALDNLNMELPAGKIVGLLGPNGSGKTTLIKVLAGLLTPTAGEALVYGEKPGTATKAFVSYLPERTYFDPGMKVRECVGLFRDFYRDFDERRAEGLLAALGVPTDRRLKTLSKGTKEKVQLVLVMSRRARLYLLDEPIGGVDPAARELILSTIVTNHDPEATVLISTHLIRDVEPILDGFVFLGGGKCIMSGDAETVRRESGKTLDELFREVFRCY